MRANQTSLTASDSFAARAQKSEAHRIVIWLTLLAIMALLTLVRRWTSGMVMTVNRIFIPYFSVLLIAIVSQVGLLWIVVRANRSGRLLPAWLWHASAIFDLLVAAVLLVVAALYSPRDTVTTLTAPPLLLMPMVVLLSVMRLRPQFTLRTGLAAAIIHLLLVIRAIKVGEAPVEPVYFSYGVILAMTALAGWLVARAVRNHVIEASEEAAAHERTERQVLGMRHDLNVAREIQLGLLPTRSPELKGFDIKGMNRPADQTGGDYYDWQTLPDGRLAVVLADVSGHGIGPALVMAVCRAYARSTAPNVPDPAVLLTRLNDLLHEDLPADRFITFVVVMLDEAGSAHLVSAGHGPTFLYHAATKEVQLFGGDGIPLGVMPGEEYGPTNKIQLEPNDVLVMLTDGFFEWARPGDDQAFGIERLSEALRNNAHGDAMSTLNAIDQAVCRFCDGSPQADDMTAIVIKRKP